MEYCLSNFLDNLGRTSLSSVIFTFTAVCVCVCMCVCLVTQSRPTLFDSMDCSPPVSSVHGDFPGKSTGVGCHFLLHLRL